MANDCMLIINHRNLSDFIKRCQELATACETEFKALPSWCLRRIFNDKPPATFRYNFSTVRFKNFRDFWNPWFIPNCVNFRGFRYSKKILGTKTSFKLEIWGKYSILLSMSTKIFTLILFFMRDLPKLTLLIEKRSSDCKFSKNVSKNFREKLFWCF